MTTVDQTFLLRTEFFDLMKTVGAPKRTLTLRQVILYLKTYIESRKLYNPTDRNEIHVADDPLGGLFGTPLFKVQDLIKLLCRQMFLLPPDGISQDSSTTNVGSGDGGVVGNAINANGSTAIEKRKCESVITPDASTSNENKRPRNVEAGNTSPMVLRIPPSPILLSGDETELSIQGYETEYAKNSTDDLWFLETDSSNHDDTFDVEYEVESAASDTPYFTDTDSDVEDVICAALLVVKDDSDVPFWADKSDEDDEGTSDDPELEEGDKWSCSQCGTLNKPLYRICLKCFHHRSGWLRQKAESDPPRRHSKKLNRNLSDPGYQSSLPVASQEDSEDLSQRSAASSQETPLSQESQNLGELCPLCSVRPKTGVIIHGSTSHQYCCLKCAKKLQGLKKRCPQCRRPIERVARNFIV